jgi:hypothetical protein
LTFEPHGALSVLPRGGTATPSDLPRDNLAARSDPRPKTAAKRFASSLDEILVLPLPDDFRCDQAIQTLNNEKSIKEHCSRLGLKPRVTNVVLAVFNSKGLSKDIYEDLWDGSKKFYIPEGTLAARILDTDTSIKNEAYANYSRSRINALLFALHFETLCISLQQDEERERIFPRKPIETIVMEKLVKDTRKEKSTIQDLLKRGRWYGRWILALGVGGILMLGESLA